MGRSYEMWVKIKSHEITPEQKCAVMKAADAIWSFGDWHQAGDTLSAYGENSLRGGETEEEFSDRLAVAIWQVYGNYLEVTVCATYLDDRPYEEHLRGEDSYREWLVKEKKETRAP